MTPLTHTATEEDEGLRLDQLFSQRFDEISRSRAKALILEGAASIDGETEKDPRKKVEAGRNYELVPPPPKPANPKGHASRSPTPPGSATRPTTRSTQRRGHRWSKRAGSRRRSAPR